MIIGDGVRLRGIDQGDLPLFVRWLNDPEVRQYLALYAPQSNAQEEKWFENLEKLSIAEQPLMMEVWHDQKWKAIGDISFVAVDQQARNAEVGLFIGEKEFWGKGIGTQTLALMLDYGFFTLNFHRIYLRVYALNVRGIHCYEKVGFKHEGKMREAAYLDGEYIDILWMGILKDEWKRKGS
ncbi:MAG: GNAT family N-acetyltransferase [Chloroflexi bacterium]|nr:GNAT family N-acetyltransferase [Chloroflexota bacterium]